MNPEQVIRSWLQDYSEGSKFKSLMITETLLMA
jgi:hypothetical protein